MKTASEQGKSSRRKGAAGERELVRMIRDELGLDVSRNLKQFQQAQEGDLTPVGPFLIEAKNCARLSVKAWWIQAVAQAKKADLIPVLAYKVARKGWRFVLPVPHGEGYPRPDGCWRYDYEFTMDVGPACFFLVVRESL